MVFSGHLKTGQRDPRLKFDVEAMAFIEDYNKRSRLRKLGFVESLDNLDQVTADVFCAIADEVDKLEEAERKKKNAKGK